MYIHIYVCIYIYTYIEAEISECQHQKTPKAVARPREERQEPMIQIARLLHHCLCSPRVHTSVADVCA